MADEGSQNPSAQAAPVAAPAGAAPAAETGSHAGSGNPAPVSAPQAQPAAATEQQPAPAAQPPAQEPPKGDAPKDPPKAEGEKPADAPKEPEQKTLLGAEPEKKTEQLKSDAPKEGSSKDQPEAKDAQAEGEGKDEGGQSDEPAPLPSFETFQLPENVKVDDERVGAFTSILGEFEKTTKAPHAEVQNLGQKMVDFHISELQNAGDRLQKAFVDSWKKQTTDWLEQTKADPEIGGNRHETALTAAVEIVNTYGGNVEQKQQLREFFNRTGVGNHPALVRLLYNISQGPLHTEGQPKPAGKAVPEAKSRTQKLYGGTQ